MSDFTDGDGQFKAFHLMIKVFVCDEEPVYVDI